MRIDINGATKQIKEWGHATYFGQPNIKGFYAMGPCLDGSIRPVSCHTFRNWRHVKSWLLEDTRRAIRTSGNRYSNLRGT